MSSSNPNGKALVITGDRADDQILFNYSTAGTAEVRITALDPKVQYGVYLSQASATDVVTAASHDSQTRVVAGNAIFNANVTQANVAADGFLGATPIGATGLKITTNRKSGATDNAAIVTALGGYRAVIRLLPLSVPPATGLTFPSPQVLAVPFA